MAGKYWGSTYWSSNYWSTNYWGGDPVSSGAYWGSNYWASKYWSDHYWSGLTFGTGNVVGTINATVDVSGVFLGAIVEYFDLSVRVGPTWTATEFTANAGTIAVTLADNTSVFTGTFTASGANLGTIAATLADYTAAISGTHVAPANRTGTLSSTLDNVTGLFTATLLPVSIGSISAALDDATAAFTGQFYLPGTKVVYLRASLEDVRGQFNATFSLAQDPGPQNPNCVFIASQYVICDRSGFKIKPADLRTEWTGAKVRVQDWEARHPQDLMRSRAENPKPSPRPEQPDVFINTPISADDL